MEAVGTADAGPFRLGLLYSYPDRFWEQTGKKQYRRDVEDSDTVHLMATAWDPATGTVFPEVGLTAEVKRDGELVTQEAVYAMLSQRLGFHYGDNFALPGDGTYDVTVSVGGLQLTRTGAFEGRFDQPASATFSFEYARADRNRLETREPENVGEPGAVAPQEVTDVPNAFAPSKDALPGTILGVPMVDDARVTTTLLRGSDAERFGGDRYVAVSPRTPYNELLLPGMGLEYRLLRGGERVDAGTLTRTIDPDLQYHYGSTLPALESDDELVVETLTPPQVARHEGYETAFVEMDPVTFRIP